MIIIIITIRQWECVQGTKGNLCKAVKEGSIRVNSYCVVCGMTRRLLDEMVEQAQH